MAFILHLLLLTAPALGFGKDRLPIIRNRQAPPVHNPFPSIVPAKDLQWQDCYQDAGIQNNRKISCTRLIAPLNYENPLQGHIQLAIIRNAPLNSTSSRTVFFNPGGPGGDPVESLAGGIEDLIENAGQNTTFIGVIPRSVGATTPPMKCDLPINLATQGIGEDADNAYPGYANTSARDAVALGKALALDCDRVTDELWKYAGTANTARDMDFVLKAMRLDNISYLGYSYGTVLGATYARLFPEKVERMVLDGVADIGHWFEAYRQPEFDVGDVQPSLAFFFERCFAAGSERCALWQDSADKIRARFLDADAQLLRDPLPIPGLGLLKIPMWRGRVFGALYDPESNFRDLAGAVDELYRRQPGPALARFFPGSSSSEPGSSKYSTDGGDTSSVDAFTLINCLDGAGLSGDITDQVLDEQVSQWLSVDSQYAGLRLATQLTCQAANLPANGRSPGPFDNVNTSMPILFVNSIDVATPLGAAKDANRRFPGSGLLVAEGVGHCSLTVDRGFDCARRWILPYFETGRLPPAGTRCGKVEEPFPAPGTVITSVGPDDMKPGEEYY